MRVNKLNFVALILFLFLFILEVTTMQSFGWMLLYIIAGTLNAYFCFENEPLNKKMRSKK